MERKTENGEKVLVAMSGGVDSSVAALLMRERGLEAVGCMMRLFDGAAAGIPEESTCCSADDADDARRAAARIGIPFYVFNYTEAFTREVIGRFAAEYCRGRTPNPCIACNRHMKFGALLRRADELGCRYIATGHYARIERNEETGAFVLKKALDPAKDQSYVLYDLTQAQLSRVLFPLGEMTKEEARKKAEAFGLLNAKKRDSQDICFAPDGDYAAAIRRYLDSCAAPEKREEMRRRAFTPGDFLDPEGRVLGTHKGLACYTVGQRRGLGIPAESRLYVQKLDTEKNAVILGDNESLFAREVRVADVNWISGSAPEGLIRCRAKIRYRHAEQPCTVRPEGEGARIVFDEPQRAATPGQSAVFYDGDTVLGGGIIC